MKIKTFTALFTFSILSQLFSVSFQENLNNRLKRVEICRSCKKVLNDLRKEKNSNICDTPNYDKIMCYELYYYLFYFQPDYFFAQGNDKSKDCEVCSNIDKCSYNECMGNQQQSLPIEVPLLSNPLKQNNNTDSSPNATAFSTVMLEKLTQEEKPKRVSTGKTTKMKQKFEENAITYLNLVKEKLNDLSGSISNFIDINSNTIKFKQNLIKLYLYIKIQKQIGNNGSFSNNKTIELLRQVQNDLTREKSTTFNLKNYFVEIQKYQQRLNDYYASLGKQGSKTKIQDNIKNFLLDSQNLLKDVENLTSKIYHDNLVNLKSFKETVLALDQKIKQKLSREVEEKKIEEAHQKVVNELKDKIKSLEENQAKLRKQIKEDKELPHTFLQTKEKSETQTENENNSETSEQTSDNVQNSDAQEVGTTNDAATNSQENSANEVNKENQNDNNTENRDQDQTDESTESHHSRRHHLHHHRYRYESRRDNEIDDDNYRN